MRKGVASAILAARISAAVPLLIFHFAGIIAWVALTLTVGVIIAAIIMFIIMAIFFFIVFFALFYYLAEKKPKIEPGEYKLEESKGKGEKEK
ncbi:MAG: hypothetical protein DRN16_03040 [Thermoplasmata archaeon]|nr:MAG: hypothetical protein DRN16_03040 [Thermoplasmata archaeon]